MHVGIAGHVATTGKVCCGFSSFCASGVTGARAQLARKWTPSGAKVGPLDSTQSSRADQNTVTAKSEV